MDKLCTNPWAYIQLTGPAKPMSYSVTTITTTTTTITTTTTTSTTTTATTATKISSGAKPNPNTQKTKNHDC